MRIFSALFSKDKKKDQAIDTKPEAAEKTFGDKFHDKINFLTKFGLATFEDFLEEYEILRKKLSNLSETNYNLGMKLLERGMTHEAARRFWITKKFWPKCYDAYYQHAYALILTNRPYQAKKVLEDLVNRNPAYESKAHELLNRIQNEDIQNG